MKNVRSPFILIVMLGSFYFSPAFAQTLRYDSTNTKNLRADFDSCVVTARKYWVQGDRRQALKHSLSALDIAVKSDSIYDDLMALRMVGQVYLILSKPDSAELYLSRAVVMADTMVHQEAARAFSAFASISILNGNYDRALRYYFLSLEQAETVYPPLVYENYHNIGVTYYKLFDFDRSIYYSEKSLGLKKKLNNPRALGDNLINLALAHLGRGDLNVATAYLDSAFEVIESPQTSAEVWAHANLAAGMIRYKKGDGDGANPFLLECLGVGEASGNIRYQLNAIETLSKVWIDEGKLDEAKQYLLKGEKLLQTYTSLAPDVADIYNGLAKVYALEGDYKAAFKYKELSEKVMDGVEVRRQTVSLMRTEGARIEHEYKQRLEDRDRLLALQAGMVSKQRTLNIVLGIAAFLTAALAFVLWRGLLRKKRIAQMLDRVVQSRTREIIERVRLASRAQEETALRTRKARAELNLFFANLKQMCTLAAAEPTTSRIHDYLEMLSKSADETAGHVGMLLSPPAAYEPENGYGEQSMF